eukprot:2368703-Amphidinium_carterae.1
MQFDNQNKVLVSQAGVVHLLSLSVRSVSYLKRIFGVRLLRRPNAKATVARAAAPNFRSRL